MCEESIDMPETSVLGRYWRGDGPLWRVYWIYGVAASAIMSLLIAVPAFFRWLTPAMLAGVLMATAIYGQWLLVSVWRCAPNVRTNALGIRRDAWGMLARLFTVAWAISAIGLAQFLIQTVNAK
jgi:hypothetical protein